MGVLLLLLLFTFSFVYLFIRNTAVPIPSPPQCNFPRIRTTRNDRRSRTIRYRDTSPEIVIVTGDISRIRSRFTFSRLSRHSYRLLYATSDKRPFYRVGTTAIDSGDCQSKRENLDFSSVPREETVKCNLSVRSRKKRKRSVLFIPFERNPRKSLLLNKRKRKNLIKSRERERIETNGLKFNDQLIK